MPPNGSGKGCEAERLPSNRLGSLTWNLPGKLDFPTATRIFLWLIAPVSRLCVVLGSNAQPRSMITLRYFVLVRNVGMPLSLSADRWRRPAISLYAFRGEIDSCNFVRL